MTGVLVLLVVGVLGLIVVGGAIAWVVGNRLQSTSQTSSDPRGGTLPAARGAASTSAARLKEIDGLLAEVRKRVEKLDDPELTVQLEKHLDDLQAKKEAAADRLSDLAEIVGAPAQEEARLKAEVASLRGRAAASADAKADLEKKQASLAAVSATLESKRSEQSSLEASLGKIADGLREIRERLSNPVDGADISKGIADSLSALHGELDAQERARREIAALEKSAR
ncbi:MAG TPA: hypothetical protein VMV18_06245 [bacterium]|nr:hypothetical protein [bacterium]